MTKIIEWFTDNLTNNLWPLAIWLLVAFMLGWILSHKKVLPALPF